MNNTNFLGLIGEIKDLKQLKLDKKIELLKSYEEFSKSEKIMDIIMIQLGKEIEEKFPKVKFRIISRIKAKESFSNKVSNLLIKAKNEEEISKINIYDTIGLSVIIEEVLEYLNTSDDEFNNHINEIITRRSDTQSIIDMTKKEIIACTKRMEESLAILKENELLQKENNEILNSLTDENHLIKEYFLKISKYLKTVELNYKARVENIIRDEKNRNTVFKRATQRQIRENDEISHILSNYIVKNFCNFENLNMFNLNEIEGKYKNKRKYNGYKATHNSFISNLKLDNQTFNIPFEVQGKSIRAFREADKGIQALYHICGNGIIPKDKKMPNLLQIVSNDEKEKFLEELEVKLPKFRIYISKKSFKNDLEKKVNSIYKLSQRENFLLYYGNELLGNEILNIEARKDDFDIVVSNEIFKDNDNYNFEI